MKIEELQEKDQNEKLCLQYNKFQFCGKDFKKKIALKKHLEKVRLKIFSDNFY